MGQLECFVYKNQKKMRCGYTTGSCAAAAAKAAVQMLLCGQRIETVTISTPKGINLELDIINIAFEQGWVSCAVQKDSGDDPDVTNGIFVYAKVQKTVGEQIKVEGGTGVGRVTRAGLACAIGEAAINPVPRRMIEAEVHAICEVCGYHGGISVEIFIPEGEKIAQKTFNPRLGIIGGISVLGTSGIVEPMSEQALIDSIKVEMKMRAAAGVHYLIVTPGNYGETFTQEHLKIGLKNELKCSNFVGETLDSAVELHFSGVLLIGHIGKFVKLAGGIMNTHSHVADARMEILSAHAALNGANKQTVAEIMNCITTDEAISILDREQIREKTMQTIMGKIDFYLKTRVHDSMEIGAIMFSNQYGALGQTKDVDLLLAQCKKEI
nr:cobalt-precorrin-5B (C(1))-methyltransferase CbiD [uncultured Caproiciproducens sp.]